jgi:hypothetical protein
MESIISSELVVNYWTVRHHILEYGTVHNLSCGDFKSNTLDCTRRFKELDSFRLQDKESVQVKNLKLSPRLTN